MSTRVPAPGTRVTVAYESARFPSEVAAVVGVVIADRYPHSYMQVDTDRGVLRIPLDRVRKIVVGGVFQ